MVESSGASGGQGHGPGGLIRPLEGLRAVAIILVLLFHLDPEAVKGGYIGVDVFFVISGFIITLNIRDQVIAGRFSRREFYVRRVRRLLPALVATILATLVAGWFLFPPSLYAETGKSALYSVVSLANVLFWAQSGYFDADAILKPLLHTWSLSVEEQFYLFWPLLAAVFLWRRVSLLTVGLLAVASFAATCYFAASHPSAAFYLTPFRVYQFACGGFLALSAYELRGRAGSALTAVAVLLLLAAGALLEGETNVALSGGIAAILAVVLIACRSSAWSERLLGNRVMVAIGRRSYSLYLVHWPVIVFYVYGREDDLALRDFALLLVLTIVLGEVLYRTVEMTFRSGSRGLRRPMANAPALLATGGAVLLTLFAGANVWGFAGFTSRLDGAVTSALAAVEAQKDARAQIAQGGKCFMGSNQPFARFDPAECIVPAGQGRDALVIGNSLGADAYMTLAFAYPGWTFSQATAAGCPLSLEPTPDYRACEEMNAFRTAEVFEGNAFDLVIIQATQRADMDDFRNAILRIREHTAAPILVIGPRVRFSPGLPQILESIGNLKDLDAAASARASFFEEVAAEVAALSREMGLEYLEISDLQCPDRLCPTVADGRLLYVDIWHMSPEGARAIARKLRAARPELLPGR